MPDPSEYTDEALLLFPVIVSLGVPFKTEEVLVPSKGWKADYLIMGLLDVEADGTAHGTLNHSRKDDSRDEELRKLGFHVLRLTNEEIIETPEMCRGKIREEIEHLPKVNSCTYSSTKHHHVDMMGKVWCMAVKKYLPARYGIKRYS